MPKNLKGLKYCFIGLEAYYCDYCISLAFYRLSILSCGEVMDTMNIHVGKWEVSYVRLELTNAFKFWTVCPVEFNPNELSIDCMRGI